MEHLIVPKGKYLSDIIQCLPCGIISKMNTGIGATSLELFYSPRNSIVVSPLKSIQESKRDPATLVYNSNFYGSVKRYMAEAIGYKKIHTTAESLPKLFAELEQCGVDPIRDNYFYLIDEYDLIQLHSDFRPFINLAFDYYKDFSKEYRACISATAIPMSDPGFKNEQKTYIESDCPKLRNIELLLTDSTLEVAANIIKSESRRLFIFVDSITWIRTMIERYHLNHSDVSIYCGSGNERNVKDFYSNDLSKTSKINFLTSAYFYGCDINEPGVFITVSDHSNGFALTKSQIIQIAGRNRIKIERDIVVATHSSNTMNGPRNNFATLHKEACQTFSDFHSTLTNAKSSKVQQAIIKGIENLNVQTQPLYIRLNNHRKLIIDYSLIDSVLVKEEDHFRLHNDALGMEAFLRGLGHTVFTFERFTGKLIPLKRRKTQAGESFDEAVTIIKKFELDSLNVPSEQTFDKAKFQEHIRDYNGEIRSLLNLYKVNPDIVWFTSFKGQIDKMMNSLSRSDIMNDPSILNEVHKLFPLGSVIPINVVKQRLTLLFQNLGWTFSLTNHNYMGYLQLFLQPKRQLIGKDRSIRAIKVLSY